MPPPARRPPVFGGLAVSGTRAMPCFQRGTAVGGGARRAPLWGDTRQERLASRLPPDAWAKRQEAELFLCNMTAR